LVDRDCGGAQGRKSKSGYRHNADRLNGSSTAKAADIIVEPVFCGFGRIAASLSRK